jgi:hypothetical protein
MRSRSPAKSADFVAAGAGADLEEGVALVVGVARQQQRVCEGLRLELGQARLAPRRSPRSANSRHLRVLAQACSADVAVGARAAARRRSARRRSATSALLARSSLRYRAACRASPPRRTAGCVDLGQTLARGVRDAGAASRRSWRTAWQAGARHGAAPGAGRRVLSSGSRRSIRPATCVCSRAFGRVQERRSGVPCSSFCGEAAGAATSSTAVGIVAACASSRRRALELGVAPSASACARAAHWIERHGLARWPSQCMKL